MPEPVPYHLEETPRRASRGNFVILFGGRTGSSHIVSCLNSHPEVICYPEILRLADGDRQRRLLNGVTLGVRIEEVRPSCARADLFPDVPLREKPPPAVVGFKAKVRDIKNPNTVKRHLRRHNYTIIHLVRNNVVKTAVSKIRLATLRNQENRTNAVTSAQVTAPIHIPVQRMRNHIRARQKIMTSELKFLNALGLPIHRFAYEDMLADSCLFFDRLQRTLGVEPKELEGAFVKNTPDDLSATLKNFDELHEAFAGTPYYEQFTSIAK